MRTQLEIREKGDLLKQENVLTKLFEEKNYLFWADGLKRLAELVPKGTSNYKIAMIIRGSIAKAQDGQNTKTMTVVEDIMGYMNQKYMNSQHQTQGRKPRKLRIVRNRAGLTAIRTEKDGRKMSRTIQRIKPANPKA